MSWRRTRAIAAGATLVVAMLATTASSALALSPPPRPDYCTAAQVGQTRGTAPSVQVCQHNRDAGRIGVPASHIGWVQFESGIPGWAPASDSKVTWAWTATGWAQRSLPSSNEWVYHYPYGSGWVWIYRQGIGWVAMRAGAEGFWGGGGYRFVEQRTVYTWMYRSTTGV
jgi:hypothetical protein